MNHAATDKAALRRHFRKQRIAVRHAQRQSATRTIIKHLKGCLKRGRKIAIYWPVGSELDIRGLAHFTQQRQVEIYYPYIEKNRLRLWFTRATPNHRAETRANRGKLNIPQFHGKKIRAERLHTLFLPLVAADRSGYRLGQGGGYYDATLARARYTAPRKIGVGFACQLADSLPHETHDMRLNAFVCERGIYRFKP